jgi:hypothetical protein
VLLETSAGTDDLIDFMKSRLARYKAPRQVIFVDSVGRFEAGKFSTTAALGGGPGPGARHRRPRRLASDSTFGGMR